MNLIDLLAVAGFPLSVAAIGLTIWQVRRGEQALARRAVRLRHFRLGEVSPGREGFDVELSIAGPAVLYEVTPFILGGMTLHVMSERAPRFDAESKPIRFVADTSTGDDADPDVWVGVTWVTMTRQGRVMIEQGIRVHLRTAQVQHWRWRSRLVPTTWRKHPSGEWGTRPVRLGLGTYYIPDVAEWMLREGAQEARRRAMKWPPPR